MARDPVSLHLDAARPRGLPVLDRRALFRRRQVPLDAGDGERGKTDAGGRGATHASIRQRSRRRSRAPIRSRRPSPATTSRGPQRAPPRRAAALRARREDAALSGRSRGRSTRTCWRWTRRARRSPVSTMTVRLIKRDWNSMLQASDFTQGTAKYVTQVIDDTLEERHVTSTDAAQTLNFDARRTRASTSCEVEATDRVGRRQTVQRGLLHGRRHAGDVVAAAGEDRDVEDRQGRLRARRERDADRSKPVPDGARAGRVGATRAGVFDYDWVDMANGVGRYTVALATRRDAEAAGACAADARAAGGTARARRPRRSIRASR